MNDGDVFVWWVLGVVLFLGWLCIASGNAKKRRLFKEAHASEPVSWRLETPGSAKFVTEKKELKPLLGRSGIRCGYTIRGDDPLRFAQDSHVCVLAPTGSGKGTDFVIPNVLSLDDHSLFIIDTKCEIAPVTIAHRAKLGPVWVLNPYEMNMDYLRGYRMAQYNPMGRLFDPKEPRLNRGPVSEKIADGLVLPDTPGVDETFWTGGGKGLLGGVMLGEAKYGLPDQRNLPAVRRILSGDVIGYCKRMVAKNDPMITDRLEQFVIGSKNSKSTTLDDIIRTANIQTRFLSDEGIAHSLLRSDFRFAELKERVCTVYVCLNLDFIGGSGGGRYFRLLVSCMLSECLRPDIPKKVPVFMLCDEAYQYGSMESLEAAYGMVRGAGVKICTIWTDLAQIEKRYPKMSRSMIGNSGAVVMMTPADDLTADFLSKQCGVSQVVTATPNVSESPEGWPQISWGKHLGEQELLLPHQAREISQKRMVVFVRGVGTVLAKRKPYFDRSCAEFRGKYRANPYYPGGVLKKWWR